MSDFSCPVVQITIEPHPNADQLEIARVIGKDYNLVVGKGTWHDGDFAVYIPEQSLLPTNVIEELDLVGMLAGSGKNRVKAIRLRGVISQGLLYPVQKSDWLLDLDVADQLGITKWVPEVPTSFNGNVQVCDTIQSYTDINNIKDVDAPFVNNDMVVLTEKIHGTCAIYHLDADNNFFVSSKGLAKKNFVIEEDEKNIYWMLARAHNIRTRIGIIKNHLPWYSYNIACRRIPVTIYGEIFGKGVQDLTYGIEDKAFRMFDIKIGHEYLSFGATHRLGDIVGLPVVPHMHVCTWAEAKEYPLTGNSDVYPTQMREGIVVREHSASFAAPHTSFTKRKIYKMINPDYLLRKGGTEYE